MKEIDWDSDEDQLVNYYRQTMEELKPSTMISARTAYLTSLAINIQNARQTRPGVKSGGPS